MKPFLSVRSSVLPFLLASLLGLLAACANPVAPSGGPRDTTPPTVVRSVPEAGAVNVDRRAIELVFSEYVDRASFEEALSFNPAFEEDLDIDFGGDAATIHVSEPLRENTTYILTLDKALQDDRGVELDAPITIAFATGPTINKGRLGGQVLSANTGAPREGLDIYAYGRPDSTTDAPPLDSLPSRPDYRTQTDSEGRFQFEYLQEQPYFVIALEDANRNRQPDPLEVYAVPPHTTLVADSTGGEADEEDQWIVTVRDTLRPQPVRIRSLSRRRHEFRFDEPVHLANREPGRWQLTDSLGNQSMEVDAVYQHAASSALIYLRTEALSTAAHRLLLPDSTVQDSSGNAARLDTLRFTPVETADTLQTRFARFEPEGLSADTTGIYTLPTGVAAGMGFNEPLSDARLRTIVTVRNAAGTDHAYTPTTDNGTSYRLRFDPPLRPEEQIEVRVDGRPLGRPDTVFTRTYQQVSNRQLGALSGSVRFADTTATDSAAAPPFVVEVYPADASVTVEPRSTRTDATGRFLFERLPEGAYRFRAFLDRNENGHWDGGQIVPFRPAEPITWSEGTLNNRPRWENILETPLRIPNP